MVGSVRLYAAIDKQNKHNIIIIIPNDNIIISHIEKRVFPSLLSPESVQKLDNAGLYSCIITNVQVLGR